MTVPTKKLNVHLINRVGSSDCAHCGGRKGRREEGSEKVGAPRQPVVPPNATYRAFRFSSEIQRPAGRPALGLVPRSADRVRSITLSVNH